MKQSGLIAEDQMGISALAGATPGCDGRIEIRVAKDGDEALEIARHWMPNLIFLDTIMPEGNGYEVRQALTRDPATADIRVVVLPGLSQGSDCRKALYEMETGENFKIETCGDYSSSTVLQAALKLHKVRPRVQVSGG